MRATTFVFVLALLISGCATSDESPAPTTPAPEVGPRDVVAGWIDAVIASDVEALSHLVEPDGLVVLAAVENSFSEEETSTLLDNGIPIDLIADYWATFRSGFADFAGIPLQSIEVGAHDEFLLGDVPFASVVISSGDGVTSVMTSRRGVAWRLDLVASFGAAFAAQLRRVLVNLSHAPAGERIRDAYRSNVIPGLLAAFRRAPDNAVLGAELERMALLLER
jgi:hypothetical protein